jgi:hypothetical protein
MPTAVEKLGQLEMSQLTSTSCCAAVTAATAGRPALSRTADIATSGHRPARNSGPGSARHSPMQRGWRAGIRGPHAHGPSVPQVSMGISADDGCPRTSKPAADWTASDLDSYPAALRAPPKGRCPSPATRQDATHTRQRTRMHCGKKRSRPEKTVADDQETHDRLAQGKWPSPRCGIRARVGPRPQGIAEERVTLTASLTSKSSSQANRQRERPRCKCTAQDGHTGHHRLGALAAARA